MNESAYLVALVAKIKEEHAKALEDRDMKHAVEMSKLMEQLNNLSATLETAMQNNKKTLDNMAESLGKAEEKLASHADEMTALHDHVLGKLSTCQKYCLLAVVGNFFIDL